MSLGKVFEMSGLYKGKNRQAEPNGGFRRLLNVWQDRAGNYRPKGEQAGFFTPVSPYANTQFLRTGFVRRFQDGIFSCYLGNYNFPTNPYDITSSANIFSYMDKYGVDKTPGYRTNATLEPDVEEFTFGRNSYPNTVVGNKLFFKAGQIPLLKFDGLQVLRAGLPLPYISCAQYATTGIVRYLRAVQVRIGFDGTLVASNYVQFPVNSNTPQIETRNLSVATELVGQPSVTPTYRDAPGRQLTLMDDVASLRIGASNWVYNASLKTMTILTTFHNCQIGDWVMFQAETTSNPDPGYHLYAMKVTNVSGLTLTFSSEGKGYRKANQSWSDVSIDTGIGAFNISGGSGTLNGTSVYLLVYSSTTAAGLYTLTNTQPIIAIDATPSASNTPYLSTVITAQTFGFLTTQITSDLSSWYDIGTFKIQFPYQYETESVPGIKGITKYQGLLLTYDKKAIYFSDVSSGGSDEMTSGLSNFVPLGTEYGDIVCVEGCEDFVLISRERKNFILTGDLSTGGFTISEVNSGNVGAFSSNSALSVNGGVMMVSRQGIFFLNSSGTMIQVSEAISRLFGTSREFLIDPDNVTFKPYTMTDVIPFQSGVTLGWDGNNIRIKYDADRNIVGIVYGHKKELGAPSADDIYSVLAISLDSGAMFEWKTAKVGTLDVMVNDIDFLELYADSGKFRGSLIQSGDEVTWEDNTSSSVSKRYLLTSWQTAAEPSLEKQVQQVKFYGQMTSCRIVHQENWAPFTGNMDDIVSPQTNVVYPTIGNQNLNTFEHKQRLNTSSPQCISIGFEPIDNNFCFEGYEIEWEIRQGSVKK